MYSYNVSTVKLPIELREQLDYAFYRVKIDRVHQRNPKICNLYSSFALPILHHKPILLSMQCTGPVIYLFCLFPVSFSPPTSCIHNIWDRCRVYLERPAIIPNHYAWERCRPQKRVSYTFSLLWFCLCICAVKSAFPSELDMLATTTAGQQYIDLFLHNPQTDQVHQAIQAATAGAQYMDPQRSSRNPCSHMARDNRFLSPPPVDTSNTHWPLHALWKSLTPSQ